MVTTLDAADAADAAHLFAFWSSLLSWMPSTSLPNFGVSSITSAPRRKLRGSGSLSAASPGSVCSNGSKGGSL
jgi:hypothetical protein